MKLLDDYTSRLRELGQSSLEEYEGNYLISRSTERLLHLAIEACLDIGHHLIADLGLRAPQDNKDVFAVLGEEGILPRELVPRLLDMAAFRNVLVHGYAKVDNSVVHGILRERLVDLDEYARAITDYVNR